MTSFAELVDKVDLSDTQLLRLEYLDLVDQLFEVDIWNTACRVLHDIVDLDQHGLVDGCALPDLVNVHLGQFRVACVQLDDFLGTFDEFQVHGLSVVDMTEKVDLVELSHDLINLLIVQVVLPIESLDLIINNLNTLNPLLQVLGQQPSCCKSNLEISRHSRCLLVSNVPLKQSLITVCQNLEIFSFQALHDRRFL